MAGLVSLQALEGRWRLSRVIRNADGSEARLSGVTVFRRDGEGLVQEEEGWLTLPGGAAPLRAPRRYLWTVGAGGLEVRFGDGRPFHGVPLGVAALAGGLECDGAAEGLCDDLGLRARLTRAGALALQRAGCDKLRETKSERGDA